MLLILSQVDSCEPWHDYVSLKNCSDLQALSYSQIQNIALGVFGEHMTPTLGKHGGRGEGCAKPSILADQKGGLCEEAPRTPTPPARKICVLRTIPFRRLEI